MCVTDVMFAVFADGTIVKCDTSTNPCTVKDQWICKDNSGMSRHVKQSENEFY